MTIKTKVLNMDDVNDKLAAMAIPPDILADIVSAALDLVLNDAKSQAPLLTGTLRRSIRKNVTVSGSGIDGRVGTNLFYGPFQEFGTVHQAGTPFLRPAWDKNIDSMVDAVASGINEQIRTAV